MKRHVGLVEAFEDDVEIRTPRDREASFEPVLLPRRGSITRDFEDRVVAMYASGMTTREIQQHVEELYGLEASQMFVSRLARRLDPALAAWRNRPLEHTYLGDWIARQRQAVEAAEDGADGRLAAAEALQRKLKLILEGEPPYDVFVRWQPLEKQPIGWEPDLNDGVLVNIWPFVQAGVLSLTGSQQKRFKYTKDRGKNPEGEPWGPERYNRYEDLKAKYKLKDEHGKVIPHLTNEVKRKARADQTPGRGVGGVHEPVVPFSSSRT